MALIILSRCDATPYLGAREDAFCGFWNGHRIFEIFTWICDVVCGRKPMLLCPGLPKFAVSNRLHHESELEFNPGFTPCFVTRSSASTGRIQYETFESLRQWHKFLFSKSFPASMLSCVLELGSLFEHLKFECMYTDQRINLLKYLH